MYEIEFGGTYIDSTEFSLLFVIVYCTEGILIAIVKVQCVSENTIATWNIEHKVNNLENENMLFRHAY